jgi:hypothetical protein
MKKLLNFFTLSISAIIIPFLILASIASVMLLSPDFYISIIKDLDIVKTFIEAKNYEIESDIKREIEKTTGISAFKEEYNKIKSDYEKKLSFYNTINKTEQYEKIEKQIDEIDDLEWEKSPDSFKSKDDFKKFKKQKIKELKLALEEIEKYRDDNEDAIEKAEDDMKKSKDAFEDAEDELKDKEKEARKILENRQGDFLNEIYHDIAKIEPKLTEKLNKLFIDTEVRKLINSYIDFFTSYKKQKEIGNIYETKLDIESGLIENNKKINLPQIKLDFNIKSENPLKKEQNLISETFVEIIRDTPGLKSPWVMSKIFSMADSWIIETISNKYLKDLNLSYYNGILSSNQLTISGNKAKILEKIIIACSIAKHLPYISAIIIIILASIILLLSSPKKHGIKKIASIIKYSSATISIITLSLIIISFIPGLLMPEIVANPLLYNFLDKTSTTIALHILIPVGVAFFLLSIVGGIILKFTK